METKKHYTEKVVNELFNSDKDRLIVNNQLDKNNKVKLGQYMTSDSIASFMANMFRKNNDKEVKLLDPGAGIGSLTTAFVDWFNNTDYSNLKISAYEIDSIMINNLKKSLNKLTQISKKYDKMIQWEIIDNDFIEEAVSIISSKGTFFPKKFPGYTHCIMNPPYSKIASSSRHRHLLRSVGIETVNLYSAFVSLAILLMKQGGSLVAIIPRSFCNGPYYKPFRKFILKHAAISKIHLFNSRKKAFKDDNVLQENIIIKLNIGCNQGEIAISISEDDSFSDLRENLYPFNEIIKEYDNESIIHIPLTDDIDSITESKNVNFNLENLGIVVSTGPVVDYRLKSFLRKNVENNSVPIIYPVHFKDYSIYWPNNKTRKPNSIIYNDKTSKWLLPNGYYTIVKRFSSKEEKRRIVASFLNPKVFSAYDFIGFENHLNVFNSKKGPINPYLAKGLTVYLNSTAVDKHFRRFSGHTQVNATDLRFLKYPSKETLMQLGKWYDNQNKITQEIIDHEIERSVL